MAEEQAIKKSDCCLNKEPAFVPLHGVPQQCSCTNHIRGISTFAPLNEVVIRAAHALFDEEGRGLPCFVAPAMTEIPGAKFLADRYIRVPENQKVVLDGMTKDEFDRIGLSQSSEYGWAVCELVSAAEADPSSSSSFSYPDGPDDQLMIRANLALENYIALNCRLPGNLRRSARILQYHLASKDWVDLKDESSQVCLLVLCALEMWEVDGFKGLNVFMRGEMRSMISDLKFWIERMEGSCLNDMSSPIHNTGTGTGTGTSAGELNI